MDYYPKVDEDKYVAPWDIVEEYYRNSRLEAELSSKISPKDSDSSLSQSEKPKVRFCDSSSDCTPTQSSSRAPDDLSKSPSSFHRQPAYSFFTNKRDSDLHQDTTPISSSPGKAVSRSPSPSDDQLLAKESVAVALDPAIESPGILGQANSHTAIQEQCSETELTKHHYEVQLKDLVEKYSEVEKTVMDLEARLSQEESRTQKLSSENEAYAKKIRLNDDANEQLESAVSTVIKLQGEKARLLQELKERDNREKEGKADHESQISSLHSKVKKMEAQHKSLKKDNDRLRLERQTWSKEKTLLVKQNDEYVQTISNIRKQTCKPVKDQLRLEAQIHRLTEDKAALLERLARDCGAYGSQLERQDSEKIAGLEKELAQSQRSEHEISQRLIALEEKHTQLAFKYGDALQSASFYSHEVDEYKYQLECSQEELFTIKNEVADYQCEISHLEEQLHSFSGGYNSSTSSTMLSPESRSPRLSDGHCPDELQNILKKIKDLHRHQLTNIRALLDDSSRRKIEFALDIQFGLKELDLQAALAIGHKLPSRRTSMNESNAQYSEFVYPKPYKEMYHKSHSKTEDLRFFPERETGLRPSLFSRNSSYVH